VLESDDEVVQLEVARLAGQLKLPPFVPALGALLTRAGTSVRRATAEALAEIRSPGAMKALEAAVTDADRDVRIAAVRAIGAERYRGAFGAIETVVAGRGLRDADLTERTAFFEAYGVLAGDDGLKRLRALLEPRGLLRRKENPQIRACAAMALGRIGSQEAQEVLEHYVHDKDPLVRNAVSRALRGGES
jgi:HEAT repeat protein